MALSRHQDRRNLQREMLNKSKSEHEKHTGNQHQNLSDKLGWVKKNNCTKKRGIWFGTKSRMLEVAESGHREESHNRRDANHDPDQD
jgi:hypothetical protein